MPKIQLRPCPFCGGRAEARDAVGDHTVGCADRNDCVVYAVAGPCDTAELAAEHWNRRIDRFNDPVVIFELEAG